ncbi:MAG: DUF975 family protein [Lachnospiraceae bacterium]|nr:DUF975 family protein [Lachnospiraceae bacterium]
MWTRRELKERAKKAFKTYYLEAVIAGIVLMYIAGQTPISLTIRSAMNTVSSFSSLVGMIDEMDSYSTDNFEYDDDDEEYDDDEDLGDILQGDEDYDTYEEDATEEETYEEDADDYWSDDSEEDADDYWSDDSEEDEITESDGEDVIFDAASEDINADYIKNIFEDAFEEQGIDPTDIVAVLAVYGIMILIFGGLGILFKIFLVNPIIVGAKKIYLTGTEEQPNLSMLFWAFSRDANYINIVKNMFIMDIKLMLWTLLLWIPGIIKSYQYKMIPYILCDNPNISTRDLFNETKSLTNGEKWNIFVLDLSFIGWRILGALLVCCCIPMLDLAFTTPYKEATYAELYVELSAELEEQSKSPDVM